MFEITIVCKKKKSPAFWHPLINLIGHSVVTSNFWLLETRQGKSFEWSPPWLFCILALDMLSYTQKGFLQSTDQSQLSYRPSFQAH